MTVVNWRVATQAPESSLLGAPQPVSRSALMLVSVLAVVAVGASSALMPLLAPAVILVLLASVFLIRYPAVGAYTLVVAVPVLSGLRRDIPVPGLRVSEFLVAFVAAMVLVFASRQHWQRARWTTVDRWLFAYALFSVVVTGFNLAWRNLGISLESVGSTLLPLQFFLLYRAIVVVLGDARQRMFALKLLLLASIAVSALAVLQQLDVGPFRDVAVALTDSGSLQSASYEFYARATGPFQHWHALAGYLTVILLICTSLLLRPGQTVLSARWLYAVTAMGVAALMLSVTFTSMIAVAAGVILLGWYHGQLAATVRVAAVISLLAFALFGGYFVDRIEAQYAGREGALLPQTIWMRVDVWLNQYIPGLSGYWALGYGPDLPDAVRWEHTESAYITLLLRGGIALLFLFVVSLVMVMLRVRKAGFVGTEGAVRAALFVVLAVSFFMNLLFPYATSSGMSQPLWVLAALGLGSVLPSSNALRLESKS